MSEQVLVSVIIPTYNSEKNLGKCLESIKNQTYKDIEIIVVDNRSEDRARDICKKFDARFYLLKGERTRAKNFGLKKAKGKHVCFIDSDMDLTPKVIEECVNKIENNEKVGGVVVPERSIGNSFWVKVRDFERSFHSGTKIESARFFKKDLVEEVDGFDEDIVCFEESVLPQKIEDRGYNVKVRIDSDILHHEYNFTLWKWLRKKFYYGKTASEYLRKYNRYGKKQTSLVYHYWTFFRNKRFFSQPILASGVLLLKALEYLSAGLGYLSHKLKGVSE
jgi:glycosyltransferase involved in cell wall biosynthesis